MGENQDLLQDSRRPEGHAMTTTRQANSHAAQLTLFTDLDSHTGPSDWTFNGASTRELTHCYHDYPARMIPQVAGKLLDMFASEAELLFDPYCGTGTSLVEGLIRGINVAGTDLNPLARLIAQAKTSAPNERRIDGQIAKFRRLTTQLDAGFLPAVPSIQGIRRPDFWFKQDVIKRLQRLRAFIDEIEDDLVRLFFQVAFSETVRESSNTRNDEFKLYRYSPSRLEAFDPDVFGIMELKLRRNREGLHRFLSVMRDLNRLPRASIHDFNTVTGIPHDVVASGSVDIVVTSPPYGDSHTTVAYGQYSRLSAAWLGLSEPEKVDRKLMGGRTLRKMPGFPNSLLNKALSQISKADKKRALEVASFYSDLFESVAHVSQLIKPGGYACYVVGNRKVKGVVLPTDAVLRDFFECFGFDYVETFHRSIPNKRMPLRNSPTNVVGALDNTMTREYIVVMRRKSAQISRDRRNTTG